MQARFREDRRDEARSPRLPSAARLASMTAAQVAVSVLGLEVLGEIDAGDCGENHVIAACGFRECRGGQLGRPAGVCCSSEGGAFSCLCGDFSGDAWRLACLMGGQS
jgi:hypothetical protein